MSSLADGRRVFFSSRSSNTEEQREWIEVVSADPTRDLDELYTVINKAYRTPKSSAESGWTTEGDLVSGPRIQLSELAAEIDRPSSEQITLVLFLCRLEGDEGAITRQLCGTIEVTPEPGEIAEFGRFAVRPDVQSKGFGRRLLDIAERIAVEEYKASQGQIFVLDCRPELLEVYRRRGFVHVPGNSVDLTKRLSSVEAAIPNTSLILEMYRKPLVSPTPP